MPPIGDTHTPELHRHYPAGPGLSHIWLSRPTSSTKCMQATLTTAGQKGNHTSQAETATNALQLRLLPLADSTSHHAPETKIC